MSTSSVPVQKRGWLANLSFNILPILSLLFAMVAPVPFGSAAAASQQAGPADPASSRVLPDKKPQRCQQLHECALRFNGQNQWIEMHDFRGFDTPAFTAETRFNWAGGGKSIPAEQGPLGDGIPLITVGGNLVSNATPDISLLFGIQASTGTLMAVFEAAASEPGMAGERYVLVGNTEISEDEWHHGAVTYDGQTLSLYLDGNLDAQQTLESPVLPQLVHTRDVYLAAALPEDAKGLGFFKGELDEVRLWEVGRSQSELEANAGLDILEDPNLIGRWGMNEGAGILVGDTSGKEKHGNAFNSPDWIDGPTLTLSAAAAPDQAAVDAAALAASLPAHTPAVVSPVDGATNVSTSPTLTASVDDPDTSNLTVTFYGRVAPQTRRPDFTIIVLPDTQKYTTNGLGIFGLQTQWIADQQSARNIAFVAHEGDTVDDWNVPRQWDVSSSAMANLEPSIPYGIGIGNCDEDHYGVPPDTTFFNTYFPVSRFAGRPYYGGAYNGDNANSYQLFSASGVDFIVIDLKYNLSSVPNLASQVLAWAHDLLQTYSNRRAIVVTHYLLTTSNTFSADGLQIYNALKDTPNLFLMVGGHYDTEGQRTDPGTDGHSIYSLRADYQTRANGGNGWLRIMRFSPEQNRIFVTTYSPYINQYETDTSSQFSLDYDMGGAAFQVLGTASVSSGSNASITWPGLGSNTKYDWYVAVDDGSSVSYGPVWSFTTAGGSGAPVITTQPADQTVIAGQTAGFSAAASGSPTPTVQWQVSTNGGGTWSNINGATSTTYSFIAQSADHGKQYRAVFTNSGGSATTNSATLTVYTAPVVTAQPANQTVNAGQTASFTAAASGYPAPTVQWQVSANGGSTWSNISGATLATYSFTTAAADNGKQYRAVFTNAAGSATSSAAALTVYSAPVVTTHPADQTVIAGQTASFTAAATGLPVPTVQWQLSTNGGGTWSNISGATSTTYSFTVQASDNGNRYRAVFTNSAGSAASNAAMLTVSTAPVVTLDPSSQTVNAGATASFAAAASGAPAPTVQWQVSTNGGATWTNITGATSTTYSFTAQAADSGKQYHAVFTNAAGSATTASATLTVNTPPVVTAQPSSQAVNAGQTASFTAAASGSPAPTVQWQVSPDSGSTWTNINGATSATYSFTAQAADNGKQYRAVFTNAAGSAATSAATLTVYTAPVITTQPADQAVVAGASVSFTAAASGVPTPTAQWQVSTNGGGTWSNISGATSATYTFTAQAGDDGKQYRAVFTNAAGSATTNAATLTIYTAPVVTLNPGNQAVNAGQTATFTAAASGFPAPTVQWQVSPDGGTWGNITGATTTSYSLTAQATDDGKQYRAVFTNAAGSATTTSATLTVYTAPVITTQPASQAVNAGQAASFTAAAAGAPAPTVQWQVSIDGGAAWNNIPGATSGTYTFNAQAADNGKQYHAVFTNSGGSTTSNAATLTVYVPPAITAHPASQAINAGQVASFSAAASGSPAPTVQWQVSLDSGATWSDIPGATSTTYSFTAQASDDGKQYHAVFSNAGGSAATNSATLTVYSAPVITLQPSSQTVIAGAAASFSAAASGAPTPAVQWQVSANGGSTWSNITGATSSTYTFTAQAADDGKLYHAVFTNAGGSATTSSAVLTVHTTPVVTTQPANQAVNAGQTASFAAAASGFPAPSVQWQVSADGGATWSNITGATSTTYSFTTQAADNGDQYHAVFTNAAGSATTNAALLTVYTPPVVTAQPLSQTVLAGDSASFTASASGVPAPGVQWQVSTDAGSTWSNIPGATSATYTFAAQITDSGKQYRAVFANIAGSATTDSATLTVHAPPVVTTQPLDQTVNAGQTASFTAAASGFPAPTVQWQVSSNGGGTWSNITGATSTTYSFAAGSADNGKQYRARFTNAAGSVTSNAATLTVYTAPAVTTQPLSQTVIAGQTASFTSSASGFPTPTIQWQVSTDNGASWSDIAGATSGTYSFTAQATDNGRQYHAVFTNTAGSATSSAATLTVGSDLIFADSFNTCNASAWPGGTVNSAALAFDLSSGRNATCGMAVTVTNGAAAYVVDTSPDAEGQFRLRFYFNPGTLKTAKNDIFALFAGYNTSGQETVVVQIRPSGSTYQLRAGALRASRKWVYTTWSTIGTGWTSAELNWLSATAAGANDGSLTFWVNGTQDGSLTGIDNDLQKIDSAALGVVSGMDSTVTGRFFIEDYESHRLNYIGP